MADPLAHGDPLTHGDHPGLMGNDPLNQSESILSDDDAEPDYDPEKLQNR